MNAIRTCVNLNYSHCLPFLSISLFDGVFLFISYSLVCLLMASSCCSLRDVNLTGAEVQTVASYFKAIHTIDLSVRHFAPKAVRNNHTSTFLSSL